ncbi:MAG: serine/threonine-protein kinase [Verrucomicrobiota bacterium]
MPEEPVDPAPQQPPHADEAAAFPSLMELAQLMPQYEMHEIIGIGGMGAVYKARQIALDRWAAIKVLPSAAAQNPEDVQRFIKEARAMAKLVHPHIVAVFDFGQTYMHHLFLVMEFVEGYDLHQRTRRGEITKERAREVIAQLCDALQFAHDRGVAHRDIKPANILITDDWKVKVADFGLARDLSAQAHPDEVEYGTPDYTAPERLIIGAPVDHRADIYSLGVVIHEMLTGKTPTAAGKDAAKGLPEGFASVISKCLMSEPGQRYQKASEVKVALLTATADNNRSAATTAEASPSTRHATKRGAVAAGQPAPESLEGYSTYKPSPFDQVKRFLGPLGWAAACVVLIAIFASAFFKDKGNEEPAKKASEPAKVVQDTPAPEPAKPAPEKKPEAEPLTMPAVTPEPPAPAMATAKPTLPEPDKPVTPPAPPQPLADSAPYSVPEGEAGEVAKLAGHKMPVHAVSLLSDQRRVLSASSDGTLRMWDLATQKEIMKIDAGVDQLTRLQVTPDETLVMVYGFRLDKAAFIDLTRGSVTHSAQFPNEQLAGMVYVPGTKTVVACGSNTEGVDNLWVWKPGQDEKFTLVEAFKGRPYGLGLMPDGREVGINASELTDVEKKRYNSATTRYATDTGVMTRLEGKAVYYITRFFGKPGDAKMVVAGPTPRVITLPDFQVLGALPPAPKEGPFLISGALVDGDRLALTGWTDNTLRAYEVASGEEVWRQTTPGPVTDMAVNKDSRWAVLGTRHKDGQNQGAGDFDLLVWRLPKWSGLQSDTALQITVNTQMVELEKHDAELADLRQKLREHSPPPVRADLEAEHQKLDTMYVTALKRDYPRLSPTEQLAYREEIERVTQKGPLPAAGTEFTLVQPLQKMRGIYRKQLETLQTTHDEAVKVAREAAGKLLNALQEKRSSAGDRVGALRVKAVLREWSEEVVDGTTQNTNAASSPPTATSAQGGLTGTPTKRPAQTGSVIAIQRKQVNSIPNSFPPHMGLIPKDLGQVVAVTGGNRHAYALLPNGNIRGWGPGTEMDVSAVKDVVQMDCNGDCTVALMGDGKAAAWVVGSGEAPKIWTPSGSQVPVRVHAGQSSSGFVSLSDGSLVPMGDPKSTPPGDLGQIKQLITIPGLGWCALRGRDGTPAYWGETKAPVLPLPGDLRDLISLSIGGNFGVALQRDGTMTGWGQLANDQRYRIRKFTAATKVYHDYASRVFPVHRSDHSWELATNPSVPEYEAEDGVGLLEGRLRGSIDAVFGDDFVVALRP